MNMAKEEFKKSDKECKRVESPKKTRSKSSKATKPITVGRSATPTKAFRPPRAARCRQVTPIGRQKSEESAKSKASSEEKKEAVKIEKEADKDALLEPKASVDAKTDVGELAKQLDKVNLADSESQKSTSKGTRASTPAIKDAVASKKKSSTVPADIKALLKVCTAHKVQDFTSLLSSPLLLDLVPSRSDTPEFKKIGEASYSEVFGISRGARRVVLKVIPLLSDASIAKAEEGEDVPDCSEAVDVRREVEITSTMSDLEGGGFIEFKGCVELRS